MSDKDTESQEISSAAFTRRLLLMAVAMFGFGYLLVPLYSVFCELTGFGGKPNQTAASVVENVDENRTVNIEFVTTVNEYAPWKFSAAAADMEIHPGKLYRASFVARNLSHSSKTGQAVPSIVPVEAARYFRKTECFCFTQQAFSPDEERELEVQFIVDPNLPSYIDTVTLSYTFFDTARVSQNNVLSTS